MVVESLYLACNYTICFFIIFQIFYQEHSMPIQDLTRVRQLAVFVNGTILMKLSQYLRLIDSFSYLIDIIFKVFDDIKSFMVVLLLIAFLCSLSFYQIGQNQITLNRKRAQLPHSLIEKDKYCTDSETSLKRISAGRFTNSTVESCQ